MKAIKECFPVSFLCRYIIFCFVILILGCVRSQPQVDRFKELRENMVATQIEARGITNREVIEAMRNVERHLFVPETHIQHAYGDHPLPIGYGQTISQPYIVAFMTEILKLDKSSKVLEVGTGSGYQAAILAEICDSVYTIEIVEELGMRSSLLFKNLGYSNIKVKIGDGYEGWDEYSPFDAIIVTCAPTHVPEPLKNQLKEGGRMIIPVGERYVQELVLLTRKKGSLKQTSVLPVRFVPMVDEKDMIY
ncbi:MAG: protein-L-isoaspartate(D-aspartate) O-methyltransferase [Bacteroidales bacterium]|nr:MAG: protein-L-isoaspartate(D-aspartate) O-methyltransferase [Bacteroidales bacterium]